MKLCSRIPSVFLIIPILLCAMQQTHTAVVPEHIFENKNWRYVMNIAYTLDSQKLVQIGQCNGHDLIKVWNATTYTAMQEREVSGSLTGGLAISSENQIACGYYSTHAATYVVSIWDLETLRQITQLTGHTKQINDVAYNERNPQILVSASQDGTARIWDLRTGTPEKILNCQDSGGLVVRALWNAAREQIATSQWQTYAKLWDIRTNSFIPTQATQSAFGVIEYTLQKTDLLAAIPGNLVAWDTQTGNEQSLQPYWQGAGDRDALALTAVPNHPDIMLTGFYAQEGTIGICNREAPEKSSQILLDSPVAELAVSADARQVAVTTAFFSTHESPSMPVKIFDAQAILKTITQLNPEIATTTKGFHCTLQ